MPRGDGRLSHAIDPAEAAPQDACGVFGVWAPGEEISGHHDAGAAKIATKCDMCKDLAGGPACVRACPTGAAIRVSPEQFLTVTRGTTLDRS